MPFLDPNDDSIFPHTLEIVRHIVNRRRKKGRRRSGCPRFPPGSRLIAPHSVAAARGPAQRREMRYDATMFDHAEYASRYDTSADYLQDQMFTRIGPRARKRGCLTCRDLVEIGKWKF